MNRAINWAQELPEERRGAVAQYRALATGKYGGHPASVAVRCLVSHGVDASVDAVEMSLFDASGDAVLADPQLIELGDRDHSMLPRRNSCHGRIERVAFIPHVGE